MQYKSTVILLSAPLISLLPFSDGPFVFLIQSCNGLAQYRIVFLLYFHSCFKYS